MAEKPALLELPVTRPASWTATPKIKRKAKTENQLNVEDKMNGISDFNTRRVLLVRIRKFHLYCQIVFKVCRVIDYRQARWRTGRLAVGTSQTCSWTRWSTRAKFLAWDHVADERDCRACRSRRRPFRSPSTAVLPSEPPTFTKTNSLIEGTHWGGVDGSRSKFRLYRKASVTQPVLHQRRGTFDDPLQFDSVGQWLVTLQHRCTSNTCRGFMNAIKTINHFFISFLDSVGSLFSFKRTEKLFELIQKQQFSKLIIEANVT